MIAIKGIKIPECCYYCRFPFARYNEKREIHDYYCTAANREVAKEIYDDQDKAKFCPLVEVENNGI